MERAVRHKAFYFYQGLRVKFISQGKKRETLSNHLILEVITPS